MEVEDMQQKVTTSERYAQVTSLMSNPAQCMLLISKLVENAYLAGANNINISEGEVIQAKLKDTGEYIVRARNYTRDKGLII